MPFGVGKVAAIGIDPGSETSGFAIYTSDRRCIHHATVRRPFVYGYDAVPILAALAEYDMVVAAIEQPYNRRGPVEAKAWWGSWLRGLISQWRGKPPTISQSYLLRPGPRVWRKGTVLNRLPKEQIKHAAYRLALAHFPGGHEEISTGDEAEAILIAEWASRHYQGKGATKGKTCRRGTSGKKNSGISRPSIPGGPMPDPG